MPDKNEKWKYLGMGAAVIFFLMCFMGQPQQFLQEKGWFECIGCEEEEQPDCWDGTCFSPLAEEIKDLCCFDVPVPTCGFNDITGVCGGDCPVPQSWTGWTGQCQYIGGGTCKCGYYPPGVNPPPPI